MQSFSQNRLNVTVVPLLIQRVHVMLSNKMFYDKFAQKGLIESRISNGIKIKAIRINLWGIYVEKKKGIKT